jgi:hypothetical protein
MARRPRLTAPWDDSFYHVYNRVNGSLGWRPFVAPAARQLFFQLLDQLLEVYCVELVVYCLMGSHFHLIVMVPKRFRLCREELEGRAVLLWPRPKDRPQTEDDWQRFEHRLFDLSAFMKDLQSRLTRGINRLTSRRGPLWDGRFKSTVLGPEALLTCVHYVECNPVFAGLASEAENWAWGSAWTRTQGDTRIWPLTRLTGLTDSTAAGRWFKQSRSQYLTRRWAREEEGWNWIQGRAVGPEEFVARFIDAKREPKRSPVSHDGFPWYSLDRLRAPKRRPTVFETLGPPGPRIPLEAAAI